MLITRSLLNSSTRVSIVSVTHAVSLGLATFLPPIAIANAPPTLFTAKTTVARDCSLKFEYTTNPVTALQIYQSDLDAVGQLVYEIYTSKNDMAADFAKFLEPRVTTVDLPVATSDGTVKAKARSADAPPRGVKMSADVIQASNSYLDLFRYFASEIQLTVKSGLLDCSRSAIYSMQREVATKREHIQRALSLIADPDHDLRIRGLRMLAAESTNTDLWGLPPEQRRSVSDLAFNDVEREISVLKARVQNGTIDDVGMFGVGLLERMHDPRTIEAYMEYVRLNHPFMGSKQALESLSELLPRPIQVLGELQQILEGQTQDDRGMGRPQLNDQLLQSIALIGRDQARPFLERTTRSKNERFATEAVRLIDELNNSSPIRN